MNRAHLGGIGAPSMRVLVALSLSLLVGACGGHTPPDGPQPKPGRPTPPPPFKERVERVPRATLIKYAQSLTFDTVAATGDQQRLMIGKCPDNCRYGPLVDIQPETGAAFLQPQALGSGRIVGRFVNTSDVPYEKLAIPAKQTSYVWVDNIDGGWRAYVIPTDEKLPITSRRIQYEVHETARWTQSIARWKWREDDEQAWFTCTAFGCCKVDQ